MKFKEFILVFFLLSIPFLINAQESRDENRWRYHDYREIDSRFYIYARNSKTMYADAQQVSVYIKNLTNQKLSVRLKYTIHSFNNTDQTFYIGCCGSSTSSAEFKPNEGKGGEMYWMGTSYHGGCTKETAQLIEDANGSKGYNCIDYINIELISVENLTEKEERLQAEKKAAEEKKEAEKKAAEEKKLADQKIVEEKKAQDEKAAADKKASEEKSSAKKDSTDNFFSYSKSSANSGSSSNSSSSNSSWSSSTDNSADKFYQQQQAARDKRDREYDEYTQQNNAQKNQHVERVQNDLKQHQQMLDIYNDLQRQQQQSIADMNNSLQALSNNLIRQAEEKRRQREIYEQEMEMRRERARIKQEQEELRKEIRLENRRSLFSQYPDRKMPLSHESIGTEVLYFFAYNFDMYNINSDNSSLYITPVFPIYKYGDGTWMYKNELLDKLAKVNGGKQFTLVGYFMSSESAEKQRNYFISDAKKYEIDSYNMNVFPQKKQAETSGNIDFWGNPIKKN